MEANTLAYLVLVPSFLPFCESLARCRFDNVAVKREIKSNYHDQTVHCCMEPFDPLYLSRMLSCCLLFENRSRSHWRTGDRQIAV